MRLGLSAGLLVAGVALSGCTTVGGWFSRGDDNAAVKPAALTEVTGTVAMVRAWEAGVGPAGSHVFSPASDGAAVFAAAADGRIVKLDLASGRELWRIETGRKLSAGVGVGDGLVVVGTPRGEVLAFRTEDGQAAWSTTLSGEILTAPVAAHGAVAVRGNDGRVWLLNAHDGKQRWLYSRALPALILRVPGDLLLTERALYAGFPGGKLVALSPTNGAVLWETTVALPRGATELERVTDVTGALSADARLLCAAAYQGRVGCFDRANGNPVWARDISSLAGVDLGDRFLFVVDEHDVVQGFDRLRGASLWKLDRLRDRRLTTPVVVGGQVAVADYQGYVHLLSLEDGANLARAASDGSPIRGRMLPLASGLIAQTANGGVMAFRIQ